MKFRIVKNGFMSYSAQATYNGKDFVTLGTFFTKQGAKQKCLDFAAFCKGHEDNVVEEFEQ